MREGGILLRAANRREADRQVDAVGTALVGLGLDGVVDLFRDGAGGVRLALGPALRARWMPVHDTLGLAERLADPARDDRQALLREIVVAMLGAPVDFAYPSAAECLSAWQLRLHTAEAAARTALRFRTVGLERPRDYWDYDDERGFTLRPGRRLIEALRVTTQPGVGDTMYSFSCYRATEYVLLLALAQELAASHTALLDRLEAQWQRRAIASGRFHDVFLREFGSMERPLPPRFYVPGDRVWFRNPDEASSDASGYEGSWTFYLGRGTFANLWKRDQPFTLESKCIEIYHWRHATYLDDEGHLRVDESVVERRVERSLGDPEVAAGILDRMGQWRDGRGVYADGGCIDRTRECLRHVHAGTTDLHLPDA